MSPNQTNREREIKKTSESLSNLLLDCVSEWDEVPSDEENKLDESKYVY